MDDLVRAGELEKRLLRIGERVPVSCPDGIKGCLVNHYRIETDPTCKQAAAEIRSLREQVAKVQNECSGWNHPLAEKIMAVIERQQDKKPT